MTDAVRTTCAYCGVGCGIRATVTGERTVEIVGDPDQVLAKLARYQDMGIEAFILSGYPHAAEADLFARHVLPKMTHGPLVL